MGIYKGLGFNHIRAMFYVALQGAYQASFLPQIGNTFRSDQPSEIYRFLGQLPAMRRWIGQRQIAQANPYQLTIINDAWEGSTGVAKQDLERDKTGQVRAKISQLAVRAVELPEKLLTGILTDNETAYDATALFADRSALSTGGARDNRLTDVTAAADARVVTSAEMAAAILDGIANIIGAHDDQGEPLNGRAQQFAVMFPTAYIGPVTAALADVFTSAGVSNTLRSTPFGVTPIHNARLAAPTSSSGMIYVFRTDTPVRSVIWQEEKMPGFEALQEGSDHAFHTGEFLYGTDMRGNAAAGLPEMCARMEFKNA